LEFLVLPSTAKDEVAGWRESVRIQARRWCGREAAQLISAISVCHIAPRKYLGHSLPQFELSHTSRSGRGGIMQDLLLGDCYLPTSSPALVVSHSGHSGTGIPCCSGQISVTILGGYLGGMSLTKHQMILRHCRQWCFNQKTTL